MKIKQKINNLIKNKNFLNNQNYIFGNREKKKLLIKFFVEKNIHNLNSVFIKISILINKLFFITLPLFIFLITYLSSLIVYDKDGMFILLVLMFFLPLSFLPGKYIHKDKEYNYFLRYIYDTGGSEYIFQNVITKYFFFNIFSIFLYYIIIFTYNGLISDFIGSIFFILFLALVILIIHFFGQNISSINFINVLSLPFIFIYHFFYFIITFIYIFIFKSFDGFELIKYNFDSNLKNKFKILNKKGAENEFYKLGLKLGK